MYKRFIRHLDEFDFVRDEKKSELLQQNRGVTFDYLLALILGGRVLFFDKNPSYDNQYVIILKVNEYCWKVPCSFDGKICRLITAFPSRKLTKEYGVDL